MPKGQSQDPSEFLPLPTASLHILLALRDGEKHGYAIMSETEQVSGGSVKLGPGTLYGSIKRLVEDGLIQESAARPDPNLDDQRRRYYRLTGLGEQVRVAEVERLRALVEMASSRTGTRFVTRPQEG
ncbi:MAG: PadR family transcriptional regulator [Actinomycetota bacterium]